MSEGSRESGGEDNHLLRFGRSMFTGAFAVTLVGMTQLLGSAQLDLPLNVGIYCFALSMPLLVTGIYITTYRGYSSLEEITGFMGLIYAVCNWGLLVAVVGVFCLFLHFSLLAAILYSVTSLILIAATQLTDPQDG